MQCKYCNAELYDFVFCPECGETRPHLILNDDKDIGELLEWIQHANHKGDEDEQDEKDVC